MKLIKVTEGLSLENYLALETRMVKTVQEPTLFTWIVRPTVIYGRHQSAEVEVNEDYCVSHGIEVVQRKSGGGCVYADEGNLMISFITPSKHSEQVFAEILLLIRNALASKGIPAVTTAHNDILVGEKKVSGWACYTTPTGTIVHGTMLYDVNLEALQQAITPTREKLNKHGVASVRQRVVNLREIHDFGDIQAFRAELEKTLKDTNE